MPGVMTKDRGSLVLYLDFDGVLHHENCWYHPRRGPYLQAHPRYTLFLHAPVLDELLRPHPEVRIVLSTSWVLRYRCAGAAKRLPPGLRARVVGATYHSAMDRQLFEQLPRGRQVILDAGRRRPASWLALDDSLEGWPAEASGNVLLTHPTEGIGFAAVQAELRSRLESLAAGRLPGAHELETTEMTHPLSALVPSDFPFPTVAAVPGAQPKVLGTTVDGGVVIPVGDEEVLARFEVCHDLARQLHEYVVRKRSEHPHLSSKQLQEKVSSALRAKSFSWGLSPAEVDWVLNQLDASFDGESGATG